MSEFLVCDQSFVARWANQHVERETSVFENRLASASLEFIDTVLDS